jgi:hypothetical protein
VTPAELKRWLGFADDNPVELKPEIVEGMADVPLPAIGDTTAEMHAFRQFLACAPKLTPGRARSITTRTTTGETL